MRLPYECHRAAICAPYVRHNARLSARHAISGVYAVVRQALSNTESPRGLRCWETLEDPALRIRAAKPLGHGFREVLQQIALNRLIELVKWPWLIECKPITPGDSFQRTAIPANSPFKLTYLTRFVAELPEIHDREAFDRLRLLAFWHAASSAFGILACGKKRRNETREKRRPFSRARS